MSWCNTPSSVWSGRFDNQANTKRVYENILLYDNGKELIIPSSAGFALLGFASEEGVRRNQGRTGAAKAPTIIRKKYADFAWHSSALIYDCGDYIADKDLESCQNIFSTRIINIQHQNKVTFVIGGGHETAYAHGLGLFKAHRSKTIGIINFDAHLDMRRAEQATSGTPFLQIADYCKVNKRAFNYLCIGASLASNTSALLQTADDNNVKILTDLCCSDFKTVADIIIDFVSQVDLVYMSLDLDVLNSGQFFAVSAPSSLGIETILVARCIKMICSMNKFIGGDIVEYNPDLDKDDLCSRVAGRLLWEMTSSFVKN